MKDMNKTHIFLFTTLFIILIVIIILYMKKINKYDIERYLNIANFSNIFGTNSNNKTVYKPHNMPPRSNYENEFKIPNKEALETCQVQTLNTEQCYKSKFFECPIVNGSYLQCTNNYIPKPTQYNADCSNRTFDMVPYQWKISENCYYDKIGFDREKEFKKVKFV